MALFQDDQGRTEKATPSRLADVRQRGDTHMSREFVLAGTMLVAALTLRWLGGWLLHALGQAMSHGLTVDLRQHALTDGGVPGAYAEILQVGGMVLAPVLLLMAILMLAVAVFGYGQIGFQFAGEVFGFRLERVNPMANWGRLFNFQAIVRTAFAALKLAVLASVLWLLLRNRWQQLLVLHEVDFPVAVATVADLVLQLLIWVAVVVMVIAAADVFWQRFDFQQRNRMTRQETEDERRRSEGDPMVKGRLRQARMELLKHRMMQAVPKADVVITNPTHFAVALQYDRKQNVAPEVVAKGTDAMAQRIRELAQEHGVPLMEDPPLARALFRAVKVGQEIPARFYAAVAAVLSHIYRLKDRVA